MNRIRSSFKPLMWFMALLLTALAAGCGGGGDSGTTPTTTTPPPAASAAGVVCDPTVSVSPSCVSLASAGTYVILTKSGITNATTSAVTGDMGVSPIASTAITGFDPITLDASGTFSTSAQVIGKIYAADYAAPTPANLTTAVSDVNTAYGDAASRVPTDTNIGTAGNIGGLTVAPGVHKFTTGLAINTDVTLSGTATDVWIFQVSGGITQASGTHVVLAGGALAQNVFWQTAGVAAIGTGAHFEGILMSGSSATLASGASMNGRVYSNTNATLDANTITRPGT